MLFSTKRILSLIAVTAFFGICHAQDYISQTLEHDGLTREYNIYVPASYDGTTAVPLLFNFHGGNDLAANWQESGDMRPIADTANFILVYPQARPDPSDDNSLNWLPKTPGTFDDVPFVSDMIDAIISDYQIDETRIYACGYSLGGEFSYELACKLSSRIAAIGAVARTMQANPDDYCAPVHPTGVLTILGTDDFISPYEGVVFAGVEYYISAEETHSYWANYNNCEPTPSMTTVSSSVERYTWSTEEGCAYVEELKVIGGGHDWPGLFGDQTIDASQEIWRFVSRCNITGLIQCESNSINENTTAEDTFKAYPNPVSSQLTLELELPNETEFRIYSTLGELVLSGKLNANTSRIDLSSLAPDVYVLKINNHTIQLIKTR